MALILESGLLAYATYVLLGVLLGTRLMAREWIGGLHATRSFDTDTVEIGDACRCGSPFNIAVGYRPRGCWWRICCRGRR